MAAVTAAVVAGVGSAYSAYQQGQAQKKAGRAQGQAAQAGMDKLSGLYDQSRGDNAPWLDAGTGAVNKLAALSNGDFSSFYEDPGYKFRMEQGLKGLDASAAARGSLFGGGHSADLLNYSQGLASQEYGNYYNRLMGLADRGQQSAQYLGNLGQNYGNSWANLMGNKGSADAMTASAGAMARAGYGNALAGAFGAYTGAGGSLGALSRQSGYQPSSTWGMATQDGPTSIYNFGNNVDGFANWNKWGNGNG